ncbi:MAG: hypothetical protein Q4G49_04500 [Paracoccus sp. (in: a-proteobacteria)]|nr:hypothetical protein [Paracoccus sp. (in: a-proteobacteria)]
MKRVVRWIGAGILAAAVMTMVLADIVLAAPAQEHTVALPGHADHAAGAILPTDAK